MQKLSVDPGHAVAVQGGRVARVLSLAAVMVAVAGCANDGGSPAANVTAGGPAGSMGQASSAQATAAAPRGGPNGLPVAQSLPAVPNDAKYTISCMEFTSPSHVQEASLSKQNLIKATGHRDFYVVHEDAVSTLYYGYYKERERAIDPVEAKRCTDDLEFLRKIGDAEGHAIFARSLVVPLPTPDPEAPPQFDLARVDADKSPDDPDRRYWSLAIADYSNDVRVDGKGRKQLAVESVIAARKMGIEAYYYNGPHASTVCIGAWPRRSVREQEANQAETDNDNGQRIFLATAPLSQADMDQIHEAGPDIKIIQPRAEVEDPAMLDIVNKYTDYTLNGYLQKIKITDPRTKQVIERPKKTFLVEIPSIQKQAQVADHPANGDTTGGLTPLDPTAGMQSGGGRLRSVTP